MTACPIGWEQRLEREGLGKLDDSSGRLRNRGSGRVDPQSAFYRSMSVAARQTRKAVLGSHRFRRGERKVYALYADGLSLREIQRRTGMGYVSVFRMVRRVERAHRTTPEERMSDLVSSCDPKTLVLFFWLLERAITNPSEVKALMAKARVVPEIRALIEPDEVSNG